MGDSKDVRRPLTYDDRRGSARCAGCARACAGRAAAGAGTSYATRSAPISRRSRARSWRGARSAATPVRAGSAAGAAILIGTTRRNGPRTQPTPGAASPGGG